MTVLEVLPADGATFETAKEGDRKTIVAGQQQEIDQMRGLLADLNGGRSKQHAVVLRIA